ncbi:MAG: hypothetical protein GC185_04095 [Alphaproteobacteria bacterium]|nr:hypothetical protein [Alphaproteobacteria bacterium]
MRKRTVLMVFALLAVLAGCHLTPVDTGRSYMFALRPDFAPPAPASKAVAASLTVGLPVAPDALDTYRVALLRGGGVWDYYAGARWADFLTGMVQDSLVKSIETTQVFDNVASDAAGLTGGLILKPEIRAFNAEYGPGGDRPVIHVRIVATLMTGISRENIASIDASDDRRAADDSLPAIQAAFRKAYLAVEKKLVARLLAAARAGAADLQKPATPVKQTQETP